MSINNYLKIGLWSIIAVWGLFALVISSSAAFAQAYSTLEIRVRYADGSAARGVRVEVYFDEIGALSDVFEGSCIVPASGICSFSLKTDLTYVIKFPAGQELDPITAFGAGSQGLDGLGIILSQDYRVGIVLSKILEDEVEPNWALLDLAPNENIPEPRFPDGVVEAVMTRNANNLSSAPTPEPIPTTSDAVPVLPTIEIAVVTVASPSAEPTSEGEEPGVTSVERISGSEEIALVDETADGPENETGTNSDSGPTRWQQVLMILGIFLSIMLIGSWFVLKYHFKN